MSELDTVRAAIAAANQGHWDEAHDLIQDLSGTEAAWLHANLHREEGDEGNARYWYARAKRPASTLGFAAEREQLTAALDSVT